MLFADGTVFPQPQKQLIIRERAEVRAPDIHTSS